MEDIAQHVANSDVGADDVDTLLDRWDGSPELIAEDLFRTRNMETGKVEDLKLFSPYQPKLLHAYFYGDESIINVYKGRRIGVSFVFCAAILVDALRVPDSNYAIVSRTKGQSQERLKDIRSLIEHSRVGFTPDDLPTDNKGELVLPNGATIRAFTGDPESARGMDSARTVFVDEMAFLEDQEATMQAFMPFINLGDHRQMLQVSTPRVNNDLFLNTHARGTEYGEEGVISIKQPSFKNPEGIDIHTPLTEQNVEPVRPDMDVRTVEAERAQDPQGFAQEYLCRPISDEYRFFTSDGIEEAMLRGAKKISDEGTPVGTYTGYSPATHARKDGMMVMGVDIGLDRDDTAIAVFEHVGPHRYLRWHTLLDRQDLHAVGLPHDSADNPEAVADYIHAVVRNMSVDKVFLDKTGPGRGFDKEVKKRLGNIAQGFNFTDKEEVQRMMGDFNFALHNDLITLVPDETIGDQLEAIVKEQRHETSKPRFTGKKHAPNGKDDLAMALVLGAYPPNFDAERSTELHRKDGAYSHDIDADEAVEGARSAVVGQASGGSPPHRDETREETGRVEFAAGSIGRSNRRYRSRHSR